MSRFIGCNLVFMLQRQADIIEPLQQELAAMLIQIEADGETLAVLNRFVLQINAQFVAFIRCRTLEQFLDLLFAQLDRQNAVLKAVIVENVGKRRCDDDFKTIVLNRPWRMLTGRAAAEVGAGKQYRSA